MCLLSPYTQKCGNKLSQHIKVVSYHFDDCMTSGTRWAPQILKIRLSKKLKIQIGLKTRMFWKKLKTQKHAVFKANLKFRFIPIFSFYRIVRLPIIVLLIIIRYKISITSILEHLVSPGPYLNQKNQNFVTIHIFSHFFQLKSKKSNFVCLVGANTIIFSKNVFHIILHILYAYYYFWEPRTIFRRFRTSKKRSLFNGSY